MKIIDERVRQQTKTQRNKVVKQDVVKVGELKDFVVRLS